MKKNLLIISCCLFLSLFASHSFADPVINIFNATISGKNQEIPEVSTEAMQQIVANNRAIVIDVRSLKEYFIDHIPGAFDAVNVDEAASLTGGNKDVPVVLYCNGPYCPKSMAVAKGLVDTGYEEVMCYRLGIPVWRALGNVTQIEIEGFSYIAANDHTSVLVDARNKKDFEKKSLLNAINVPVAHVTKSIKKALNDGRLPVDHRSTRIIVFGENGQQAKPLAKALTKKGFHNVSFYDGYFNSLVNVIK